MRQPLHPISLVRNLTLGLFLCLSGVVYGQVSVTPSGPKDLCVGGTPVTLDDITVAEGADGDFGASTGLTYIILPPGNFQFVSTSGAAFASSGSDLANVSFTRGPGSFIVTYDHTTTTGLDEFTITGLQITAITAPSGPANIVTDNGSTSTSPAAVNVQNHGTVTSDQPTSATLDGNATICVGSSTNLTVTISGGTSP